MTSKNHQFHHDEEIVWGGPWGIIRNHLLHVYVCLSNGDCQNVMTFPSKSVNIILKIAYSSE